MGPGLWGPQVSSAPRARTCVLGHLNVSTLMAAKSEFYALGRFLVEVVGKQTRRSRAHEVSCPHKGCLPSPRRRLLRPGPSCADGQLAGHGLCWRVSRAPRGLSLSHSLFPLSPSLSCLILSLSSPPSHRVSLEKEAHCRSTCIAGHSQETSKF